MWLRVITESTASDAAKARAERTLLYAKIFDFLVITSVLFFLYKMIDLVLGSTIFAANAVGGAIGGVAKHYYSPQ